MVLPPQGEQPLPHLGGSLGEERGPNGSQGWGWGHPGVGMGALRVLPAPSSSRLLTAQTAQSCVTARN